MNERAYLESGGSICPNCGSKNIEGAGEIDWDGMARAVDCKDCDFGWWDIYKLAGMEKR